MTEIPEQQMIRHAYNVPIADSFVYRRFGMNSFIPAEYTDFFDESMSWKRTCYIGDWSPLFKLKVEGPDAIRFFSDISVNSFGQFPIGRGKQAIFCSKAGMVTGDGVLMRLGEETLYFQSGPGAPWAKFMFDRGDYDATCEYVTDDWFIFQVSGPNSLYVLEKVTGDNLRDIGFMRFRETGIGNMRFHALRQGMAGELGYELHGPSKFGRRVYEAILEAGGEFGIRRLGSRTMQVNHVEACFPTSTVDYVPAFHGENERPFFEDLKKANARVSLDLMHNSGSYELHANSDMYRTPFELGWGKSVKFDHDFHGREALEAIDPTMSRKVVTLVWNPDDVVAVYAALFAKEELPPFMELPRHLAEHGVWADAVLVGGETVGIATSRCYSVYFREMISLCVIDPAYTELGTEVEVLWGKGEAQKRIRAKVAPAPYKRDNRRLDVNDLPSHQEAAERLRDENAAHSAVTAA
jgi:glycine cleavage system aminomethyltransferase T